MNWRTDKPTANVIVAKIDGHYLALRKYADNYYTDDTARNFIPYYKLVKWADLEEDETVTDCHQLEDEIDSEWAKCKPIDEGMGLESAVIVNEQFYDIARHFARWGAEHLIDGNKVIGDHIADDNKKVSGDSIKSKDLEEAARTSWFNYGFKAGANWQREQDHDACYQCEKNYDTVFFRGEQHAIKMLKEEAIEASCFGGKEGEEHIVTFVVPYFRIKDHYTLGDKARLYIFKDNKE